MPILHSDRIIGRIDPRHDRARHRLTVNAVYPEPDASQTAETGRAVGDAVAGLAAFLGATETDYGARVPEGWRVALHA